MHDYESSDNAESSSAQSEGEKRFTGSNVEELESYIIQRLLGGPPAIREALCEHNIDASLVRITRSSNDDDRQSAHQLRCVQMVQWQGENSTMMREILLHSNIRTDDILEDRQHSKFQTIGDVVEEHIESLPRTGLDFLINTTGELPPSVAVMPSTDHETVKQLLSEDPRYEAIEVTDAIPHYRIHPSNYYSDRTELVSMSINKAVVIADRIRDWSEEPDIQKVFVGYDTEKNWTIRTIRLKLNPLKCIRELFANEHWDECPENLEIGTVPSAEKERYERVIDDLIELRSYDNNFSPDTIENIQREIVGIAEDHEKVILQFVQEARGRDVFVRLFALRHS